MKGAPYITRTVTGLRKPKVTRVGVDVTGQVEVVGSNVTQFKAGDELIRKLRALKFGPPKGLLQNMRVLPKPYWS